MTVTVEGEAVIETIGGSNAGMPSEAKWLLIAAAALILIAGGAFLFKALGKGNLLIAESIKIPLPAIILLVLFGVFYFVLNHTTFGRRIYATGSNAKCAKLVCVDTVKT
ncbi:MAG: hypothetical protein IJB22_07370, partial [Clostridia bacterium]|nr:hypothetical protein [Clostridia bacterium]